MSFVFDAITTTIPTTQQSMYAIAHHAKFGNGPLMSEMIDAMKAISHASCCRGFILAQIHFLRGTEHTIAIDIVARANGSPTI